MKKPETLTDLIRLYIEFGWVKHDELVNITKELLEHMGPVKLDEIIREAQRQKLERVIPNRRIKVIFAGVKDDEFSNWNGTKSSMEFVSNLVEGHR